MLDGNPREDVSVFERYRAEIGVLRSEMHTEIGRLRTEMHTEFGSVRAEMKDLELRMTVKFFTGLGIAIAGIKALDFLIG